MNNTLNLAIRKVSRDLSVDQKLVEQVYKSYWLFIKTYISSIPLREMTVEELESTVSNFNLPFLGKLYVDQNKFKAYRKQVKVYKDVKVKENKAYRLPGTSD